MSHHTHRQQSSMFIDTENLSPLLKAAAEGHYKLVKRLIANGEDVNKSDKAGYTPLMLAASVGHDRIVNHLVSSGANVQKQNRYGRTALHHACMSGHLEVVRTLMNKEPSLIDQGDEVEHTPLMLAASEGHDWIVTRLLSAGANVYKQDSDGRTALHHACMSGHLIVVRTLTDKEPTLVNQGDKVEHTPLMLAASQGHHEVVYFLTAMPVIRVNKKSKKQQTALHLTCLKDHLEVVYALLYVGVSIDECDESGLTPLMLAASEGHDRLVFYLLRAGANVQKQGRDGRTALHHACMSGHLEVVRTLMSKEPSLVNQGDKVEYTPLMLAASEGHDWIVTHLIRAGGNVRKQDSDERTALHHACVYGHLEVVRTLMDKEPSLVNQGDEVEHTPLMLAASQGHHKVVNFLTTMSITKVHKKSANRQTALHLAYLKGHLKIAAALLNVGASIDECDESGLTPLMLAASEGHDWIVTHLIRAGGNVRKQDSDERTALHHACVYGHLEVVRTLMDKEPSLVNQGDEVEHTPLMLAASQGHHKVVNFLTTMSITKVHKKSANRQTALHLAYLKGHLKIAAALLNVGASIDECDESGLTPLMLAASEGHDWIVTHLIRAGANVQKQDSDERTALHHACVYGHLEVVRTLMDKEPSLVNQGDEVEHTPLMLAASQGHHKVVNLLTAMPVTRVNKKSKKQQTVLHLTCLKGQLNAVNALLLAGANIDECDESGLTPLMLAASEGHDWIVTHLIRAGANVQKQDSDERTALHHACMSGHLEVVRTLMSKEPSLVNQGDKVEYTPLMLAASEGHDWIVTHLIRAGGNVRKQDSDERTALHHACVYGHLEVVRTLMDKEPSLVNQGDEVEHTPLMLAASQGHHKVVNFLTTMSITKVHKKSANRQTALHLAYLKGHLKIAAALLNVGASIDECDESGRTPLMLAASEGHDWIVTHLIRAGANVQKQDSDERTALHHACMSGHLEVVRTLMSKEPSLVNQGDKVEYTPLMLAASEGHDWIVTHLIRAGGNVRKQDSDERTALHHACVYGHLEVVRTLMDKEPSLVNQGDEVEHTPLMLAASQGHHKVVNFLTTMSITKVHKKSANRQTALHLAYLKGHLKIAAALLNVGASIDECDESGLTPLMLAASEGHDWIVTHLIRAGANVQKQDSDERTALHHACVYGHLEVVRTLMDKEPSLVNQGDEVEHTPLMLAASQGHYEVVNFLTAMPVTRVNKKSKKQQTALHLTACLKGQLNAVNALLLAGANIDECDESGLTPLMLAASEGHDRLVFYLLRAGANVQKQNRYGRTALHHACMSGHLEVVRTLMSQEPSLINQGDVVEHTPLMLAASQGHHEVVNFLTTMSITKVHKKSANRQTALHLAYLKGHLKIAAALLNVGASVDECDESGLTPLMLAASEGHDWIVTHLIRAGANVHKQDSDGRAAIHFAAEHGTKMCVGELLSFGAKVDIKDIYLHTALTVAAIKRRYSVAILLLLAGADATQLTRHEGRDLAKEVLLFAIRANRTGNVNCLYFCALFQQDSGVSLQNWDHYKQAVATLILSHWQLYGKANKSSTISDSFLLSTDPPMTELMWSSHKGYDSLVKYLILQGVDVNAQNPNGDTALHFAAQGNHIQCGLLLAKAGANVRTTNKLSLTPFVVSSEEFRNGILEMLSFQTKKICCILGNALNGKSTLIASLQNENASRFTKFRHRLFGVRNISQRTAGIEPVSLSSKRYGNVLFYDFAGQHEYHGPHELFLESIISRGLSSVAVVAVVNITEEQSAMFQQLNRWLQPFYKLPSTTNPIPVILVGSHLDKAKKQDEAKRHNLDICCEQLKHQGHSVLQFGCICCLDCRKPYAPDIQKLCKYLQDVPLPQCEDSRTGYSLPWVISQIRSSFTEEVLPLSEFAAWICQNKANLPTNLPPAEGVCRDLASTGHFLYLPSKRDASDGWLVLDLPSMLKDLYGNLFSSGKSKVSKVGLLSCAQLPTIFPRFEPSLVRSILISLGFGIEVDPSFLTEATHLIEGRSDREHEHLFIPALVTANQPNVFANVKGSAATCCWQFKVDEKLFFSPRILQAVILRLAGHYVFPHKQGSEVKPLSHRVWSNGIFWKSLSDVDVAVQISDNTAIHVIGCSEVSAEALCRYMSTVVQDIARTIKSIDPNIYGSAYIVCPQPTNPQFLLKNPRPPAHQKFPIDAIVQSIRNGSETTLSLDLSNGTGERKSISELFEGFKPSLEAVQDFFVLQGSTAQPSDPSSVSTASTEPHPNQVLPTTENTDPPGASDHTGMLDGTTLATPTGPYLTTPTDPDLTSHNDPPMSKPNMEILDSLVVSKIASNWHRVCIHLGIPPEVQKTIKANDPSDVEQCCRNMFIRWLSPKLGSGAKPRTWESVLTALQKADYPLVAEDVRKQITGRTVIMSSSTVVTPNEDILPSCTGISLPTLTSTTLSNPNMEVLDNLVHRIAAHWDLVGLHLGITSEDLQIVRADCCDVEQCCRDMFDRWLLSRKGTGEKPRTWESVLSALEKADYSNVAADLRTDLDPTS